MDENYLGDFKNKYKSFLNGQLELLDKLTLSPIVNSDLTSIVNSDLTVVPSSLEVNKALKFHRNRTAYKKAWYIENKEKCKAYYKDNKERISIRNKLRYESIRNKLSKK